MRSRTLTLALAAAMVMAACGPGDGGAPAPSAESPSTTASPGTVTTASQATTTAPPPEASTSTAAGEELAAGQLVYGYVPDEVLTYTLDLDQTLSMRADGDEGAFGDEDLPLVVDLEQTIQTVMTYATAAGPEPGTTEITITADFAGLGVSGTANGEPFDPADDDLGLDRLEPIDVTVVVDEKGRPITATGPGGEDLPLGDIGGLQSFGLDPLQKPLGPVFPDRELAIGDTWTDEQEVEGPDGEPIVSRATHTVTGSEVLDGNEVLVIESVTESSGFEFDLAELFGALFEGLGSLGEDGGADGAEVDELLAELEFAITVAPSSGTATTWFDPEAGLVRRAEQASQVGIGMRFRGPDDATGELVGFTMDMAIDQRVTLTLVGGGA